MFYMFFLFFFYDKKNSFQKLKRKGMFGSYFLKLFFKYSFKNTENTFLVFFENSRVFSVFFITQNN